MNKYVVLLILIILPSICFAESHRIEALKSRDRVIKKITSEINKKIKAYQIGIEEEGDGRWKLIGIFYNTKPMTKEQARKAMVFGLLTFLKTINEDPDFKKHMQVYPFSLDNIEITMSPIPTKNGYVEKPYIQICTFFFKNIRYSYTNPNDPHGQYIEESKETFEEAVKILKIPKEVLEDAFKRPWPCLL